MGAEISGAGVQHAIYTGTFFLLFYSPVRPEWQFFSLEWKHGKVGMLCLAAYGLSDIRV
jgi:hypothetical protein